MNVKGWWNRGVSRMADKDLIEQTAERLLSRIHRTVEEFNKAKYLPKADRDKFEKAQATLLLNYLDSLLEETEVELKDLVKYFLTRYGFKIFKMAGKLWRKKPRK